MRLIRISLMRFAIGVRWCVVAIGVGSIAVGAGTGYALDELRDKAADPNDDSPAAAIVRGACDVHSTTGYGYLAGGIGTGLALDGFCRPYYQQSGFDAPTLDVPFEGGQCEGVLYSITGEIVETSGPVSPFPFGFTNIPGPISLRKVQVPGTSDCRFEILSNGAFNRLVSTRPCSEEFANVEVVRQDGQPDNCGNPEGTVNPGASNPGRQPGISYPVTVFGDNWNITVNEDVDVNNNPVLEVALDIGGVQIGPKYAFNPAVDVRVPAFPQPSPVDGTPVETSDDAGEVNDDISETEQDDGFETVGYRWQFSNVPSARGQIPGTTPARFFPVLGSLQLKYENEGGLTFYSEVLKMDAAEGSLTRADPSYKVVGVSYNKSSVYGPFIIVPIRARRE